jgi:periplasmic divalent cation tolerance protein
MSDCAIVTTTTASLIEAKTIARALIEERIAACVQYMPIHSCYGWNGEVIVDEEVLLIIKCLKTHYDRIEARIKQLHSYETPAISLINIERGSPQFLAWIAEASLPTGA